MPPAKIEKSFFEIPYYHSYISPALAQKLLNESAPSSEIEGLLAMGAGGGLESPKAMRFLVDLYTNLKEHLSRVLSQRTKDREFIDSRVRACFKYNQSLNIDFEDANYKTVIGLEDAKGRVVIGPLSKNFCRPGTQKIAPVPDFMLGPHVTLFGPPDSAKMSINAMNSYHRKLTGEPEIVTELLSLSPYSPTWGADDEDSKTPIREDLISAAVNLTECFKGTIQTSDPLTGKNYQLAKDHLAQPMKRFPGLALPCNFLFYDRNPIPLHLYDFAIHLFHNWDNPKALVFYVPKLENEEEAAYIHQMISTAEAMIKVLHPSYSLGTVRTMIVLENPRAILRAHEIIDALYPYFIGASLGWHDYLASTARLFKEDANYRIPVKADPNIVIKYIQASHRLLADVIGSRGGIKVGGMYGLLPANTDIRSESFQITLKGFFKDVITQLKRNLTGFWVAHPDFVRLGLAIVEAWRQFSLDQPKALYQLTSSIFTPEFCDEVDAFIKSPDVAGLDVDNPNYARSLLVADIKESDFIAANHPDEIRYNVFQTLQYLTDWLSGNGCVALPTIVDGVPVRVMDDLATAERSRWEVWAEIYHGRFSVVEFLKIAFEELHFIRKGIQDSKKVTQIKWDERTEKWYPVAFNLMIKLMTDRSPPEFATELLLLFTSPAIRSSDQPWDEASRIDSKHLELEPFAARFIYYFEKCGESYFANSLASKPVLDLVAAQKIISSFPASSILSAANFHGDIGEDKKTLDHQAAAEQSGVLDSSLTLKNQLKILGQSYLKKFGFKFLISAKGKSAEELVTALDSRLKNTLEQEINNARTALWQITHQRILGSPLDKVKESVETTVRLYPTASISFAVTGGLDIQSIVCTNKSRDNHAQLSSQTNFEIASLSKTLATAFACDFFAKQQISLNEQVLTLLQKFGSGFVLETHAPDFASDLTLRDLMTHRGLNMHYVKGFSISGLQGSNQLPTATELLLNPATYGYEPVKVISKPGTTFSYSGGGFLILEHLIETIGGQSIHTLTRPWLEALKLSSTSFDSTAKSPQKDVASGYFDNDTQVQNGRLAFPAFAAGALSTPNDVLKFLIALEFAYHNDGPDNLISHDTARLMLHAQDKGCREFMGCLGGMGVFVVEAGENRLMLHQGANEGFRSLYLHCFSGPDRGKGFVICVNQDNKGVFLVAQVAAILINHLRILGIDYQKLNDSLAAGLSTSASSQEQLVNKGFKELLFTSFIPDHAESPIRTDLKEIFSDKSLLQNAKITSVSNDRFAPAENVISPFKPVFDPELFGRQGKIMDSWESARHNSEGVDWIDLKLASPESVKFVRLSTEFHDGNHAPQVSISGRRSGDQDWSLIVDHISLNGHSDLRLKLDKPSPIFSEIRIEMFPDGGLTRVQLFNDFPDSLASTFLPLKSSKSIPFTTSIPKTLKPLAIPYTAEAGTLISNRSSASQIDYASAAFGGRIISASNEHYSPAVQVISPFTPLNMFDGLESARSRVPGHFDEVVIELAGTIKIEKVIVDFTYFINNSPKEISVEALVDNKWEAIISKTSVKEYAGSFRSFYFSKPPLAHQIRVKTFPDGGINRIHVFGNQP